MVLNETITESQETEILPILGNIINGTNEPFADLYLLDFPELYDIE